MWDTISFALVWLDREPGTHYAEPAFRGDSPGQPAYKPALEWYGVTFCGRRGMMTRDSIGFERGVCPDCSAAFRARRGALESAHTGGP